MLLRSRADDLVAITQPAHARLAGDLAEAWGNADFAAPSAGERFAAALHDIGWLDWDLHPDFDSGKKRPRVFADVPVAVHTRLWEEGVRRASAIGFLIGVLVSQHAETIYERTFDFSKAAPENARLVREFLDRQRDIRASLVARIERDPGQRAGVEPRRLRYAKRLIGAVDYMSLLICWGLAGKTTIADTPAQGEETLSLELLPRRGDEILVSPWPFGRSAVDVAVEGRRLRLEMADEAAMRAALAEADIVTIQCVLKPRS